MTIARVAVISILIAVVGQRGLPGQSFPCQGTKSCVYVGGPLTASSVSSGQQGWIVGEIRAFAFGSDSQQLITNLAANGWAECAGQAVDQQSFPELYSLYGTTWGTPDKSNDFYLPDLRGLFLMGWNHGRVAPPKYQTAPYTGDEDLNSRVPPRPEAADAGGSGGPADAAGQYVKDHVGMMEADQIRSHNHAYQTSNRSLQDAHDDHAPQIVMAMDPTMPITTTNTHLTGGAETHPVNAMVMFFIYLGHPFTTQAPNADEVKAGATAKIVRKAPTDKQR